MKFLVTGGAGFLGAALANRLARGGHMVRVLDDLTTGDPERLARNVLFTRGDVTDVPKLWTLLQDVDCVYHLAARVSVPESILYPREYNAVNVGGTVAVMEAIRDAGVKRVVLTSSGAIYGAQIQQPVHEDLPPNPDSPYAVSKLAAEHYVRTIGALWNIETVCLRIFNTYGPGQPLPPSHAPVIPQFIKQALSGGSIVVFGEGGQTRDFVYIDDVIDALEAAALARQVDREVINVGSGEETSLSSLIELIERLTHNPITPLRNTSGGGVKRLWANIGKAQALLNYRPKIGLEEGLRLTIERDPRFSPSRRDTAPLPSERRLSPDTRAS
ncbi:MAG TPA: NAD-dependent epimerase/dehydratase family protein [Anaerolineae bacterium]|nr:NAD-dependent epimerase/dehydratase family protein [Anaerolineae bacterium]